MSKTSTLDMAAVQAALFAGEKLATVAERHGLSGPYLHHLLTRAGVAFTWTTAEERQHLARRRASGLQLQPST